MSDLISRQAAIDALVTPRVHDVYDSYWNGRNKQHQEDIDAINALPSAQPERDTGYSDGFADGYKAGKKDAPIITDPCTVCKWKDEYPWDHCTGCKAEGRDE